MPNKGFRFELKQLDPTGTFTGLASVYGIQDLGDDIVEPGAFSKTLAASGSQRPLLWQHQSPIGMCSLTDTGSALACTGKLSMGLQLAQDAYTLLTDGIVQGLSIGFQTVKEAYIDNIRHLSEIRLWEVSLVTFPMQPLATVSDVKSHNQHQSAAVSRALKEFRADILGAFEER